MKSKRICAYIAGKKKVHLVEAKTMVDGDLAIITDIRAGELNGCLLAKKRGKFTVFCTSADYAQYFGIFHTHNDYGQCFDDIFVELVGEDDSINFYKKAKKL